MYDDCTEEAGCIIDGCIFDGYVPNVTVHLVEKLAAMTESYRISHNVYNNNLFNDNLYLCRSITECWDSRAAGGHSATWRGCLQFRFV